jgi:ATP phosphoribosyltransferase regulatory subunit
MTESAENALLPAGMRDVLPPDAAFEAAVVERLMASFAARGFERVKPPLLEFEASLLAGSGTAMAGQTFRLMDPVSQRMMGLRPDMTLQVARIAATRLKRRPRPLRLSYAGQVLRVKGTQLRSERQFGQVGAELIGSAAPAADAEVIVMAIEALNALGVTGLSVDLGLPTLVPAVVAARPLDATTAARLRAALDRKDAAAVAAMTDRLGQTTARTLERMLSAAGPASETLSAVGALDLPSSAAIEWARLADVVTRVRQGIAALAMDEVKLTVDPVENRGFEYHTGVTFTFFAGAVRGELGSGGRYMAGNGADGGEPATGLTLFMDTVLSAVPAGPEPNRVYLPAGTPPEEARRLRAEGWVTVAGLEAEISWQEAARRLNCGHALIEGTLFTVAGAKEK